MLRLLVKQKCKLTEDYILECFVMSMSGLARLHKWSLSFIETIAEGGVGMCGRAVNYELVG